MEESYARIEKNVEGARILETIGHRTVCGAAFLLATTIILRTANPDHPSVSVDVQPLPGQGRAVFFRGQF